MIIDNYQTKRNFLQTETKQLCSFNTSGNCKSRDGAFSAALVTPRKTSSTKISLFWIPPKMLTLHSEFQIFLMEWKLTLPYQIRCRCYANIFALQYVGKALLFIFSHLSPITELFTHITMQECVDRTDKHWTL